MTYQPIDGIELLTNISHDIYSGPMALWADMREGRRTPEEVCFVTNDPNFSTYNVRVQDPYAEDFCFDLQHEHAESDNAFEIGDYVHCQSAIGDEKYRMNLYAENRFAIERKLEELGYRPCAECTFENRAHTCTPELKAWLLEMESNGTFILEEELREFLDTI